MIEKSRLQEAADKNIIEAGQVEPLFAFLNKETLPEEFAHEEPLKFIRNFGDIYISVGILILLIASSILFADGLATLVPVAIFIVLAEWLVRIRHLVLPGMVILLSILYLVSNVITSEGNNAGYHVFGALSITSYVFYLRYKMPFTLLPLAASLLTIFLMFLDADLLKTPIIFSACGVVIFAIAMWFDSRDTKRISHLSDSAFWLHLFAAPLIVHGVMITMLNSEHAMLTSIDKELIIFALFAVFFMIALLVDRRSMLVSSQLYILYAVFSISYKKSANFDEVMVFLLIAIAMVVIYFGAYWYKTRQVIYGRLDGSAISRYIPSLNISDVK